VIRWKESGNSLPAADRLELQNKQYYVNPGGEEAGYSKSSLNPSYNMWGWTEGRAKKKNTSENGPMEKHFKKKTKVASCWGGGGKLSLKDFGSHGVCQCEKKKN